MLISVQEVNVPFFVIPGIADGQFQPILEDRKGNFCVIAHFFITGAGKKEFGEPVKAFGGFFLDIVFLGHGESPSVPLMGSWKEKFRRSCGTAEQVDMPVHGCGDYAIISVIKLTLKFLYVETLLLTVGQTHQQQS
ncbi:hypothetical protein [Planococcus lenghuensis]|uniref:hypothetical protein n=1 Tax=Planococcus lenghuensis TaxID=2213202 RepID=UPI001E5B55B4|nr:hypothetical protein [Planococcus lenghuensis]